MPDALYALRMAPGTEDTYRAFGEAARRDREVFAASRRRFGISRHASWMAWVDGEPWSLVVITSEDLAATSQRSLESDEAFDVRWRSMAREIWGEQMWDGMLRIDTLLDLGAEADGEVHEFLAGVRRLEPGEPVEAPDLDDLGLDRLLVTTHDGLLLTYASGDVSGALDRAAGTPAEPLLESLWRLPMPEPVIAWTAAS